MFNRFARMWRRVAGDADAGLETTALAQPLPSRASARAAPGIPPAQWHQTRRERRALYPSLTSDAVKALRDRFPQRVQQTLRAGERILRHEFDLLGSGPYQPVDPDRPVVN